MVTTRAPLCSATIVRPPWRLCCICMPFRLTERICPFGRMLAVPPPLRETCRPGAGRLRFERPPATVPLPALTVPCPAFVVPCPVFVVPRPALVVPCPVFVVPCPVFVVPCAVFVVACAAVVVPCPEFVVP